MTSSLQRGPGAQALHLQLAQRLRRQIQDHALPGGSRLGSVRESARRHGVNPQTVVAAYDLLQAQGLIEARPRQGFFVRAQPAGKSPAPPAGDAPGAAAPDVAATALPTGVPCADALAAQATPGAGTLPAHWLPLPHAARALRELVRCGHLESATAAYGPPQGDTRLLGALSAQLAALDVPARREQLLSCNGATQALDLIVRAFTRAGDSVMVEQPGWPVQFAQLRRAGLALLPVPRRDDGPDLDRVQHWARTRRPRLMVVVSRQHNPTGGNLSAACAHRLLELAHAYDFLLVEDDVYAPLCDAASPLLSALDGLRRSFLIGGFSKLLAPGWRVGYIAAPADRVQALRELKALSGLGSPMLTERALALWLERGAVQRQAAALRERLARARQRSVLWARQHGFGFDAVPQGLFGWVDTGVDTEPLAQLVLAGGWRIAPGRLFDPEAAPSTRMRVNFAHAQDLAFWSACRLAARRLAPRHARPDGADA